MAPHRCLGKQAETCSEYLRKGRAVCVEGQLQTREWEDRDGNKRWTTEVKADRVLFLGGGDGRSSGTGASAPHGNEDGPPIDDADIPF